jgi:hypothetical protein
MTSTAWRTLHRVLTNAFLRGLRRKWMGEIATGDEPDAAVDETDALVLRASVVAAVRRLPPRQCAVIALRYLADLTGAETAAAMRCSTGTVKGYSARELATLRANPASRAVRREGHAMTDFGDRLARVLDDAVPEPPHEPDPSAIRACAAQHRYRGRLLAPVLAAAAVAIGVPFAAHQLGTQQYTGPRPLAVPSPPTRFIRLAAHASTDQVGARPVIDEYPAIPERTTQSAGGGRPGLS